MTALHAPTGTVYRDSADLLARLNTTRVRADRARLLYGLADLAETPADLKPVYVAAAICELSPDSATVVNPVPTLQDNGLVLGDAFDRRNWARLASTEEWTVRADAYTALARQARKREEDGAAELLEILSRSECMSSGVTLSRVRTIIALVFFTIGLLIFLGGMAEEGHLDGVWAWITSMVS